MAVVVVAASGGDEEEEHFVLLNQTLDGIWYEYYGEWRFIYFHIACHTFAMGGWRMMPWNYIPDDFAPLLYSGISMSPSSYQYRFLVARTAHHHHHNPPSIHMSADKEIWQKSILSSTLYSTTDKSQKRCRGGGGTGWGWLNKQWPCF